MCDCNSYLTRDESARALDRQIENRKELAFLAYLDKRIDDIDGDEDVGHFGGYTTVPLDVPTLPTSYSPIDTKRLFDHLDSIDYLSVSDIQTMGELEIDANYTTRCC